MVLVYCTVRLLRYIFLLEIMRSLCSVLTKCINEIVILMLKCLKDRYHFVHYSYVFTRRLKGKFLAFFGSCI